MGKPDLLQRLIEVPDPFVVFGFENPLMLENGCRLVLVPEEENRGIADERLVAIVAQIEDFIRTHGVRTLITNGVMNTDHDGNSEANRASDDRRAQDLIRRFAALEGRRGVEATLIDLKDVFIRQPQLNLD